MAKDKFYFDGHIHFPRKSENTSRMIELGIDRGLDAVGFIDYNDVTRYEAFAENQDLEGNRILDSRFQVKKVNPLITRVSSEYGDLLVFKGEEVKTREGHVLVWGIDRAINGGLSAMETCEAAYEQSGIVVIPHPEVKFAEGLEAKVYYPILERFRYSKPIAMEINGQIPEDHPSKRDNFGFRQFCRLFDVALVGGSDIHGRYLKEYEKICLRMHSAIIGNPGSSFLTALKAYMIHNPRDIDVYGNANTLQETIAWNLESVRQNGFDKVKEVLRVFR